MRDDEAHEVLGYWFSGTKEERQTRWWGKSDEVDAAIREEFAVLMELARDGDLDDAIDDPWSTLALVLLLDQMPRNAFRGTAAMYHADDRARAVTREALARSHDEHLDVDERSFLVMPLMHAEETAAQDELLAVIDRWASSADEEDRARYAYFRGHAVAHGDIVRRFGRFPHRNEILDRESSEEELAFLKEPGSSF